MPPVCPSWASEREGRGCDCSKRDTLSLASFWEGTGRKLSAPENQKSPILGLSLGGPSVCSSKLVFTDTLSLGGTPGDIYRLWMGLFRKKTPIIHGFGGSPPILHVSSSLVPFPSHSWPEPSAFDAPSAGRLQGDLFPLMAPLPLSMVEIKILKVNFSLLFLGELAWRSIPPDRSY